MSREEKYRALGQRGFERLRDKRITAVIESTRFAAPDGDEWCCERCYTLARDAS